MADSSSDDTPRRPQPPPIEFVRPGETSPTTPQGQQPAAWVPRPEDYLHPAAPRPTPSGAPGNLHLYAGIVLVVAGVVGIGYTLIVLTVPPTSSDIANLTNLTPTDYAIQQTCALVSIWAQIAALLAGVMAIQRLNWKLSMASATFGVFIVFPYFLPSILALVGLALILFARREFLS